MATETRDWFLLEYRHILEKAGEEVLRYILKCGTHGKSPAVSLDEYLRNLPADSTANYNKKIQEKIRNRPNTPQILDLHNSYLKKIFKELELKMIRSDPSFDSFDITLLFQTIQIACEKVADCNDAKWTTESNEMEFLVRDIKTRRNYCIHAKIPMIHNEEKFLDETEKLTQLLVRTLEATTVRYGRDESEFITKKSEVLNTVDDARKEIQRKAANNSLPDFKMETNKELHDSLNNGRYLDPLHFLSGHEDNRVEVQTVFSRIDMISHRKTGPLEIEANDDIDYLKLLKITQVGGQPQVLLIEGDAGSGKTTLITFILSEWLQDECDRRMEGLQHYDLLLQVLCREESISTLDDLLRHVLPESHIKYGPYLLSLVKQCKVIFLIDGVDEMNDVSNKLVTDILNEGKHCDNFTVVCTSRPETVHGFKFNTHRNYRTTHVRILGISPEERTSLVVRHYEWLAGGACGDTDSLRQKMEEIAWMELFRLPLNLLFLATVLYYKPTAIETTLTQLQLYRLIHEWCIQKLLHRLHPTIPETKHFRTKIDTVLRVAYRLALQGLLQHRIYLTGEDENVLSSSCSSQGLPKSEVMPAFYSLQRKVTHGVPEEWYCSPHKGFQDFFAAQHIVDQTDTYKQGDIRRVLQNTISGHELDLKPLRNMLCHLLGLLNRKGKPGVMAMEEAVDLIRESGVEYSRDWLAVVADTVRHPAVLQRVAFHIKNRPGCEEIIEITDSTVHAAAVLLPLVSPCTVMVRLERTSYEGDLQPVLACHKVVGMRLRHHFLHPGTTAASGHLLQQFPQYNLEEFRGHLGAEHLPLLPTSLRELSLVVADNDHARSLLPALALARRSLPKLSSLKIHIPVTSVNASAITHALPADLSVSLILSGVAEDKVEATWCVAAALCSTKKEYSVIRFPGASLTRTGWQRLVQGLADAGIRVKRGLRVPSSTLTQDDTDYLNGFTKSLLKAKESRRVPEYMMWL